MNIIVLIEILFSSKFRDVYFSKNVIFLTKKKNRGRNILKNIFKIISRKSSSWKPYLVYNKIYFYLKYFYDIDLL